MRISRAVYTVRKADYYSPTSWISAIFEHPKAINPDGCRSSSGTDMLTDGRTNGRTDGRPRILDRPQGEGPLLGPRSPLRAHDMYRTAVRQRDLRGVMRGEMREPPTFRCAAWRSHPGAIGGAGGHQYWLAAEHKPKSSTVLQWLDSHRLGTNSAGRNPQMRISRTVYTVRY